MRISDWSSDVCSSDLAGSADHAAQCTPGALARHVQGDRRQRRDGMARSLPAGLAERGQRAVTAQRLMSALLADVGGTNARFALLRDGTLGSVIHLMVADHPSAYEAVAAALERLGAPQAPTGAGL